MLTRKKSARWTVLALFLLAWASPALVRSVAKAPTADLYIPHDVDRLPDGSTLITDGGQRREDQTGSRVIKVDKAGNVIWSFDQGLNFAHNADPLPNGNILISDTGNDRAIEIDAAGNIIWSSDDITLSDGSTLRYPNDANWIPSNHLLITDRDNHRVVEIARDGSVVWQFGETGVPGNDADHLDGPHNADRLPDGNTIIADSNNNRVVEIAPDGSVVWEYAPVGPQALNWPRDADRLPGDNTLVTDSKNNRIVEVTPAGEIVWEIGGLSMPYDADRLPEGNTLISGSPSGGVIEVDGASNPVWHYPPDSADPGARPGPVPTPNTVDVALPSSSTGSDTGTLAVRVQSPSAENARYPDGAPVIIWLPGGFEVKGLAHELPTNADDVVIITFAFPGDDVPNAAVQSDGVYDYRGQTCIQALRDVILYSAGELADDQGHTIDDVSSVTVLHDNIGLIGVSNGGNIIVAVAALHGEELVVHLRYVIQWETPVSGQIATRDFGRVWLKPSPQQGDYFNPRYPGYDPLVFAVDYGDLSYDPQQPFYPVFHDGNGDGRYTTIENPTNGFQTPDLNRDGVLGLDEDFPLDGYPDGSKTVYARPVSHALADNHVLPAPWPEEIATPDEADTYWDIRESVRLYDEALANIPDLEGMVLGSVRDHVQSAPDKPHLRQAFEGWLGNGGWVQINPSPAYLVEADPALEEHAGLPDNAPNTPPADWGYVEAYCVSEDIPDAAYQLAAIWQMADRAHGEPDVSADRELPGCCRGAAPLLGLGIIVVEFRRKRSAEKGRNN